MQRKRRGLLALWIACVLLLTTQPITVGADSGSTIGVKLYAGTEVLKPGSKVTLPEGVDLQPGVALDSNQANLKAQYGADMKNNCPDGYTRDGWRIWSDESGLVASRWVGDTDANWADYMTGCFDYDGNTMLAPNWVPEYAAGNVEDSAAVIKKTEDGSILVNGDTVPGGSVGEDGSVTVDGTTFHFQWLHEYKVVKNPTKENEIAGSANEADEDLGTGDRYDESTGQWIKDDESVSTLMGIKCELKPGDVVVVKDLGSDSSDLPYYFNGFLANDSAFVRTYFATDDKENKVFYATVPSTGVPSTGGEFLVWLGNANKTEEVSASISVFRADSAVTGQTGAVFTGAAGNYCCQISYEKDVDDGNGGTEKKAFSLLSDSVTVSEQQEKYEIKKVCGGNGVCGIEVDGEEIFSEPIMAAAGQTVTVKAVPADGYEDGTISVKKTGVATAPELSLSTTEDENGNKIRTFTMPDYPVTVSVDFKQKAPKTYTVTLPEGEGYIAKARIGSSSPVAEGGYYSFTVTIGSGYEAKDNFKVKANGIELFAEAGSAYTYAISNIKSDQVITVEGVGAAVIDTVAPVITGIEDGETYYGAVTFKVEDASLAIVEVDGNEVQLDANGTYTILPDNESHTIVARDTADNMVSCTISVYETWVRDGITVNGDYMLKVGTPYKLGAGTWRLADDDTVYAGGNTFYVLGTKSYKFWKQFWKQ